MYVCMYVCMYIHYVYIYIANAEESYIKWLVHDGINQNYWPVVMNYRGRGGVLLKVFTKDKRDFIVLSFKLCFFSVSQ